MKELVGIIGAVLILMAIAGGSHGGTGLLDHNKALQNEIHKNGGYVVYKKQVIWYYTGGIPKLREYPPDYIKSDPPFMYINEHSVKPGSCFNVLGYKNGEVIITYDYSNCTSYPQDFKLSAVMVKWKTGFYSVITSKANITTSLNDPIYGKLGIRVTIDPEIATAIKFYANKGEIKDLIIYLFNYKDGTPVYIKFTIPLGG